MRQLPRVGMIFEGVPTTTAWASSGADNLVQVADVYEAHATLAFSLAVRIVGDAASAERIVEEAFRRFLAGYRPEQSVPEVRVAILAEVRRLAIEECRRRGDVGRDDAMAPGTPDPHVAVELAYFEGLNHRQIAARLGCSVAVADRLLRDGLRAHAVA